MVTVGFLLGQKAPLRLIAAIHGSFTSLGWHGACVLPRDEQVRGDVKALPELADHGHAELALAVQNLAYAARRAEKRHEISSRKAVLIH